jgi:hypothetical protein
MLESWTSVADVFPPEIRAEYVRQFTDPDTVHAICEEYRAAATLDVEYDESREQTKSAVRFLPCGHAISRSRNGMTRLRCGPTGPTTLKASTLTAALHSRGGPGLHRAPIHRILHSAAVGVTAVNPD